MSEPCNKDADIAVLIKTVETHEREIGELRKVAESLHKLATSVAIIATQFTTMQEDIKEIKVAIGNAETEVDKLYRVPAEEYMQIKRSIVVYIVLGFVAAFMAGNYFFK